MVDLEAKAREGTPGNGPRVEQQCSAVKAARPFEF